MKIGPNEKKRSELSDIGKLIIKMLENISIKTDHCDDQSDYSIDEPSIIITYGLYSHNSLIPANHSQIKLLIVIIPDESFNLSDYPLNKDNNYS